MKPTLNRTLELQQNLGDMVDMQLKLEREVA